LGYSEGTALWRNWQTQETQNLPPVTRRVGSTPTGAITYRACEVQRPSHA
jgi:hypothetical protein